MVRGTVRIRRIQPILPVGLGCHVIVDQVGLVSVDVPDAHASDPSDLLQACTGQSMIEIAQLAIIDIRVSILAHILANQVCVTTLHKDINRILPGIGVQVADRNVHRRCRWSSPARIATSGTSVRVIALPGRIALATGRA